ncbi:hypothetical protein Tco_0152719 [Tanacetum coccineum]
MTRRIQPNYPADRGTTGYDRGAIDDDDVDGWMMQRRGALRSVRPCSCCFSADQDPILAYRIRLGCHPTTSSGTVLSEEVMRIVKPYLHPPHHSLSILITTSSYTLSASPPIPSPPQ